MELTQDIINHFIREEGYKKCAYKDHLGYPTIGIGALLSKNPADWSKYKDLCWSDSQIIAELKKRFNIAVDGAKRIYGNQFNTFSHNRQLAIVDNIYQMGYTGYSNFTNSIKYIKAEKWEIIELGYRGHPISCFN